MRYLSLFSGIGGFELGIGDRGECIGFSEIDPRAIEIYQKHFPTHKNYGDITTIDATALPDFDFLCGGFPCQSFSIAGKRGGFNDTRGTMFFDIARILQAKKPVLLLLENVKGLLSHDEGRTFATIISTLDELGYDLQWQVLNSKNHGVPQNRERVFIIGHLRGEPRPEVFPFGEDDGVSDREVEPKGGRPQAKYSGTLRGSNIKADGTFIRENPVAPTIRATQHKSGDNQTLVGELNQLSPSGTSQGYRVYGTEGIATTIASQAGGVGAKTGLYAIPVLTPDRINKRQNGRRFKEDGDPSFTLTSQDKHGVYDGMKIRRLTPTECERLQGFPDGWTEGVSDTQRYKTLGNAVTVNVIKDIIVKLK